MKKARNVSEQPSSQTNAERQIAGLKALLSKVAAKLEPEADEARQWMLDHSPNPALVEFLQQATLMTLRVLDGVGRLEPVNGITISKEFGIPKGSVSKITRRLIAQELVTKEALPNNKKEVLFRLTPTGRDLFELHGAFDQQMELGLVGFLQRYEMDELGFLAGVLQDIVDTSFLEQHYPPRDETP